MTKDVIEPLEGEAVIPGVTTPKPRPTNYRQIVAIAVLLLSIIGVLGFTLVHRFTRGAGEAADKTAPPDVASGRVAKLDMPPPAKVADAAAPPASGAPGFRVGEIDPDVAPIPLRGASSAGSSAPGRKVLSPEDAPIFAAGAALSPHPTDRAQGAANAAPDAKPGSALDAYQRQAAPLIHQLQRLASGNASPAPGSAPAPALGPGVAPAATVAAAQPLFGSMDRTATPTVQARLLADRSLIIPKGTFFTCSLKTRIITATSGFVGCQVVRNVYSENRVLLIERGAHLDGEYRVVQVKPGLTRIPVLWTRVRMPNGVFVDLDSPATGSLGESGIGGYVDNRWVERLGAALLLSLVDDAVKLALASQGTSSNNGDNNTLILPNTTAQASTLAEKVLDATINIPPLLYQNQGGVAGIYVSRDLDFSSVYELKPQ
jgi:type IV secretion system protein VirB10